MTIHAMCSFIESGTDSGAGNYNFDGICHVSDGTTDSTISIGLIQVPLSLDQKHADKFLRDAAAAAILAQLGLTIAAADIYIPFSAN